MCIGVVWSFFYETTCTCDFDNVIHLWDGILENYSIECSVLGFARESFVQNVLEILFWSLIFRLEGTDFDNNFSWNIRPFIDYLTVIAMVKHYEL